MSRYGNAPYGDREADGPEFAMGSVRGYRNWHVNEEGLLLGSVQRTAWSPGVNLAECTVYLSGQWEDDNKPEAPIAPTPPSPPLVQSLWTPPRGVNVRDDFVFFTEDDNSTSWDNRSTGPASRDRAMARYDEEMENWRRAHARYEAAMEQYEKDIVAWEKGNRPHRIPDLRCMCGLYALSDPENPEFAISGGPGVWGVMEGFGKTLVGEKGFRSEKGKILAVVVPQYEPVGNNKGFDFDFDVVDTTYWGGNRSRHHVSKRANKDRVQADLFYKDNVLPPDLVERVQSKYPEVAIYPTKSALIAEFGVF